MASKRERTPIYRRGHIWWARFTVAGQEYRRSLRTDKESLAQRRADELHAKTIAASHFGEHRVSWKEAYIQWAEHQTREVSPNTMKRYNVSIGQLEVDFSELYIDQIDRKAIRGFVERRRKSKVTNATIRRDLVALSSVLSFAAFHEWREGNPAKDYLDHISESRQPIVLPSAADIERVIARAHGNLAHLIRAAWLTGCRQDELVTAERRHFNAARRTLQVVGKGRKLRTVSLSAEAVACLSAVPPALHSPVLFHHGGEPYANVASRFRALVVSAQKAAQGFRPFRFHDLRHVFAVDYLRKGVGSIYRLQEEMGHSSVKVTEIYLKYLTPEEAEAAKQSRTKTGSDITVLQAVNGRNSGEVNDL